MDRVRRGIAIGSAVTAVGISLVIGGCRGVESQAALDKAQNPSKERRMILRTDADRDGVKRDETALAGVNSNAARIILRCDQERSEFIWHEQKRFDFENEGNRAILMPDPPKGPLALMGTGFGTAALGIMYGLKRVQFLRRG